MNICTCKVKLVVQLSDMASCTLYMYYYHYIRVLLFLLGTHACSCSCFILWTSRRMLLFIWSTMEQRCWNFKTNRWKSFSATIPNANAQADLYALLPTACANHVMCTILYMYVLVMTWVCILQVAASVQLTMLYVGESILFRSILWTWGMLLWCGPISMPARVPLSVFPRPWPLCP